MSARNFIKLRGDLLDSPKVFQAAEAMACEHDTALGVLVRWLLWVDAHCVCEDTGLTPCQVDELLGRDGAMVAMEEIAWVSVEPSCTVRVLEYDKHLSPTAKERQLTAARVAACKARKRAAAAGVEVSAGLKAKGSGKKPAKKKEKKKADKFRVVEDKSRVIVCYAKDNALFDSFSKRAYGTKVARGIALNMCNALNDGATPDEYARLLEAYKENCKKGGEA